MRNTLPHAQMIYRLPEVQNVAQQFLHDVEHASSEKESAELRRKYLGRKGEIAKLKKLFPRLDVTKKKALAQDIASLTHMIEERLGSSTTSKTSTKKTSIDVTQYEPHTPHGSLHPYTHVVERVENAFINLGFRIADGPELETDYHNFEALNIPQHHPARDMFDTFWLDAPDMLLRTHTSTVQSREMARNGAPLAIAAPGRCYRYEATDASHDFMFLQCESLYVARNVSMSHLLGTIKAFFHTLFPEKEPEIRVRPSYFPFVEPGIEIDMMCPFCHQGCSVCKKSTWIEVGGAGLVHPNVLQASAIDPHQYSGFAFGFGLTRLVMLMYNINDIRLLHRGSLPFLQQFSCF